MGRLLVDHLHRDFDVQIIDGVFDSAPKNDAPEHMLTAQFERSRFDVVYFEGGVFWPSTGDWKIPEITLRKFVKDGGVAIAADVGRGAFVTSADLCPYANARDFFGSSPIRSGKSGDSIVYSRDYAHNLESRPSTLIVALDRMRIEEWLKPTFEGIDHVVLESPVALTPSGGASVLLSGNFSSTVSYSGDIEEDGFPHAFGTVHQLGLGMTALITAIVSYDQIVDAAPDNARWISNLCRFLTDEVGRERSRRTPRLVSSSEDGRLDPSRSIKMIIEQGESERIEFKSTARLNLHTNVVDKKMTDVIIKTVCGFLNASGGELLIGVGDDGKILGLRNDMETLQGSRDRYERFLRQQLDNSLSTPTAGLVNIRFEQVAGYDICVITSARSRTPVFAKPSEGAKEPTQFWVRKGNETEQFYGDRMMKYMNAHWA